MADLTIADAAVVLILVLSAMLAFARGFIREVLAVGGWIGAIFAVIFGLPYLRPYARDLTSHALVADVAAGAAIFIFTLVVLSLLTHAAAGQIRSSALNALDRSLGVLFGLVRGAVIICILYIAVSWLFPAKGSTKLAA